MYETTEDLEDYWDYFIEYSTENKYKYEVLEPQTMTINGYEVTVTVFATNYGMENSWGMEYIAIVPLDGEKSFEAGITVYTDKEGFDLSVRKDCFDSALLVE